jgi:hypothetical protein
LSEQLHSITAHFDTLRAVRFQDAIDKRIPKRRQGLKLLPPPEPVTTSQADNITYSRDWLTQQDSQPEVLESQQELMNEETRALQVHSFCLCFVCCFLNLSEKIGLSRVVFKGRLSYHSELLFKTAIIAQ